MRMSSLRVIFSLSALFFLPNAAHARPIELSDFRRALVTFQRLADDQFAIDEKSEHKNRGWGLGLIFRPADLLSDSMATSNGTGGNASAGGASAHSSVGRASSANGLSLSHPSGSFAPSEQNGLHLGALHPPGQPGLRLGALDPQGPPGLHLGTASQSDNSSDPLVTASPHGESSVNAVPESSTMTLFGSSLIALFLVRRRQSTLF
jgi:hypothetical protein